jgi:hypothetical protein
MTRKGSEVRVLYGPPALSWDFPPPEAPGNPCSAASCASTRLPSRVPRRSGPGAAHGDQLSTLKTWVVPYIGAIVNGEVRVVHTEATVQAAKAKGRKPCTMRAVKRATVAVMHWGQDHDWLSRERDFATSPKLPVTTTRRRS